MDFHVNRFPFAHTFSIVARDPDSGEMGVAVQSHWFSVGSVVAWGEPGVGVVATQSMVDKGYGPRGLALMQAGKTPAEALSILLEMDPNKDVRQVAMIDRLHEPAVHTGLRCIVHAGHIKGDHFSFQANMMLNETVPSMMAEGFESSRGSLPERMMAALVAAQTAGGDIRGQQSASMLVVSGTAGERPWDGVLVNLRVDDHPKPVDELRRLLNIHRAYEWMNLGDEYLSGGKIEEALIAYRSAAEIAPELDELPFWQAVTLADLGQLDQALPIFKVIFQANPNWAELVKRLPAAGLMKDDPVLLKMILEA